MAFLFLPSALRIHDIEYFRRSDRRRFESYQIYDDSVTRSSMICNKSGHILREGFKFFLRSGIKVHKTNVFVRRVHQYWSHEKHVEHKVGKFPLDDFKVQ